MKRRKCSLAGAACPLAVLGILAFSSPLSAGGGGGGGDGTSDDGPLNDKKSESGILYGDLCRIDRYRGWVQLTDDEGNPVFDAEGHPVVESLEELKKVPAVDTDGTPLMVEVDGTWTDPEGGVHPYPQQQAWVEVPAVGGEPKLTEEFAMYREYEDEENPEVYVWKIAPFPSQCVQPVADYERWGDISGKTGLSANRLPLVMTYDPTWKRTECEIDPGIFITTGESWNGETYYRDIYYYELVEEVEFGRLNLARAPQAVLDASFDEAVRTINQATDIRIDPSGRLVLTLEIYDEFLTNPDGSPLLVDTVEKTIDSPKENLALYLKLMTDGHLITPARERAPIDFSLNGGIPILQLLEIEDGPSDGLRPTIDIDKMKACGLGYLVGWDETTQSYGLDVQDYYVQMEEDGGVKLDDNGNILIFEDVCPADAVCSQWRGIIDPEGDGPAGEDFPVAASCFAAAADKKGHITTDKIVYINSILGINKVVGSSEDGDINYAKNPEYFNYRGEGGISVENQYSRTNTFTHRRGKRSKGDDGEYLYDGLFTFLDDLGSGSWQETEDAIHDRVFDYEENVETIDIGGFTSMADDNLQVIKFTHTYQIPGLR